MIFHEYLIKPRRPFGPGENATADQRQLSAYFPHGPGLSICRCHRRPAPRQRHHRFASGREHPPVGCAPARRHLSREKTGRPCPLPIVAERPRKLARHASVWNIPPISNSSRRDDGGTHPASSAAAPCLQIPTGFWPTAQGWRPSAYLGSSSNDLYQPQRGCGHRPPPPFASTNGAFQPQPRPTAWEWSP